MNRKTFIAKTTTAVAAMQSILVNGSYSQEKGGMLNLKKAVNISNINSPSGLFKEEITGVFNWMKTSGWIDFVSAITEYTINTDNPSDPILFQTLASSVRSVSGCEDFAGHRLIEPGYPAFSLIYHLLASPLVTLMNAGVPIKDPSKYPTLQHLDIIENYIYSLKKVDNDFIDSNKMVLAVFAYEYRPARKTPHEQHADLVFARAGISRIGSQSMAYDNINRCFTNLPSATEKEKEIAVTPARYGLFLAEKIPYNKIALWDPMKADDDGIYDFIRPIRKIFNNDPLIGGSNLFFTESHRSEKLSRLAIAYKDNLPDGLFDLNRPPFIRQSSSSLNPSSAANNTLNNDKSLVNLTGAGSSALIASVHAPLARRAFQDLNNKKQRVRLKIPEVSKTDVFKYTNRRYTSFKTMAQKANQDDVWDTVWENTIYKHVNLTNYHVPRNTAMFVNIREQVDNNGEIVKYLSPKNGQLQEEINKSYWAGLFEDSICDGCVSVEMVPSTNANNKISSLPILPAFSIVTAPDFFPYVDSQDIRNYENLFLIGGVNDMGGARFRANPGIYLPGTNVSAFPVKYLSKLKSDQNSIEERSARTILSVFSDSKREDNPSLDADRCDKLNRTNFLPDSATRIFYPGWDVTYAGPENHDGIKEVRYFATYGLGSPFVEDSKLCAAANGMWAAASPDAARTFKESLSKIPRGVKSAIKPPTAIPLTDLELGIHPQSPMHSKGEAFSTGWDGEQGPFIREENRRVKINYTDIGAADYVRNALDNAFDMSQLRKLTINDVKLRMKLLERCYKKVEKLFTNFWLVGVERVSDWSQGTKAYCIPDNLFSDSNRWFQETHIKGNGVGYLYIFCKTEGTVTIIPDSERREINCSEIYCFQLNENDMAYCHLMQSNNWTPKWM